MTALEITIIQYLGWPLQNLGLDTGYPDRDFSWLSSVPTGESRDSTLQQVTTYFFHVLSNSSFTYHPFIRRYIILSY
jgi:hypothetical protein